MTCSARVRWLALAALCALPFAGQVATSAVSPYMDLDILNASVPAKIKAGSFLTIEVTVEGGGCATYDRMLVTRSAGKIDLRLQMLRPRGNQGQFCTMESVGFPVRYMDPLFFRSGDGNGMGDSVTVTVNGKRAGVVKVVPR